MPNLDEVTCCASCGNYLPHQFVNDGECIDCTPVDDPDEC